MTGPELLGLAAAGLFVLSVLAAGIADAVNAFRTGHSSGACVPVHGRDSESTAPASSYAVTVRAGTQPRN